MRSFRAPHAFFFSLRRHPLPFSTTFALREHFGNAAIPPGDLLSFSSTVLLPKEGDKDVKDRRHARSAWVRLADLPVKFSAKVLEHKCEGYYTLQSMFKSMFSLCSQSMFRSVFQSIFQRGESR